MSQTVYRELFTCIAPVPAKIPAPVADIEQFLAASTFRCQAYAARIRPEQCEANRAKGLYLCDKCSQERPVPAVKAKKLRGRPRKEATNGAICP